MPDRSHSSFNRSSRDNLDEKPTIVTLETNRLHDQFKYFWKETIEAMAHDGVPVPLDMLDERSDHLFNFVRDRCPLILFELIGQNPECKQLIRSCLSLILVTIELLKRKIYEVDKDGYKIEKGRSMLTRKRPTALDRDMLKWSEGSLELICDPSHVSILVNIFEHIFESTTIELSLSVIEAMVTYDHKAALVLLTAPYNVREEARIRLATEMAEREAKLSGNPSMHHAQHQSPSSIMRIVETIHTHRNRDAMAGACASIVVAVVMAAPPEHRNAVAYAIAHNTGPLHLPFGHHTHFSVDVQEAAAKVTASSFSRESRSSPTHGARKTGSGRMPKGNPLDAVLEGFSKVSRKMAKEQFGHVMHSADPLRNSGPVVPGMARRRHRRTAGGMPDGRGGGSSPSPGSPGQNTGAGPSPGEAPQMQAAAGASAAAAATALVTHARAEWSALHLFVRFLGRHSLYLDKELSKDPLDEKESSTSAARRRFKHEVKELSARDQNIIAMRNSRQSRQLDHSHAKVVRAVCVLIMFSRRVATEALSFRRIEALLDMSCRPHAHDASLCDDLANCRRVLSLVREVEQDEQEHARSPVFRGASCSKIMTVNAETGHLEIAIVQQDTFSTAKGGSRPSSRSSDVRPHTPAAAAARTADGGSEVQVTGASLFESSESEKNEGREGEEEGAANAVHYSYDHMGSLDKTASSSSAAALSKASNMGQVLHAGLGVLAAEGRRPQIAPTSTVDRESTMSSSFAPDQTARVGAVRAIKNGRHVAPESPMRKGIPAAQRDQVVDKQLHQAFFRCLPGTPNYPARIETEVIMEQPARVVDILAKSVAESRRQERKIMEKVVQKGYVLDSGPRMGTSTINILERARRTYDPRGRPLTAGETYLVRAPVTSKERKGIRSQPQLENTTMATATMGMDGAAAAAKPRPSTGPPALRRRPEHELEPIPSNIRNVAAVAAGVSAAEKAPTDTGIAQSSSAMSSTKQPPSAPTFGVDGSGSFSDTAEIIASTSIEFGMHQHVERERDRYAGRIADMQRAPMLEPAPAPPSMDPLATLKVDGFDLDASETFADGYADFTPGYAMVSPKLDASKQAKLGEGFNAGEEELGQVDPNAKSFNEEGMSIVMQSLDLLFPE